MESKHWVQSSRYTDCVGAGGRSSRSCKQEVPDVGAGCTTCSIDVLAHHSEVVEDKEGMRNELDLNERLHAGVVEQW